MQFRNGPLHKGVSPFENVINPANVSLLAESWVASTGAAIPASPAIANGVAYVASFDHNLYAFDATSGILLPGWPRATGGPIGSSPAVANGVVYVGSQDHKIYAFNATTGVPLTGWPVTTGGEIEASPTVVNGVVYIGSEDNKIFWCLAARFRWGLDPQGTVEQGLKRAVPASHPPPLHLPG